MNYSQFIQATKIIILKKKEIIEASQSVENTMQIVFSLIQSVIAAYTFINKPSGEKSRVILDEDASDIISAYVK